MEKIKGFQISSMTVSGFKCYEEPTEITFGNPTIVTGGNGRGKSSLADAIAFAVTGLPFFGERGIDRLHNETNPDLQITMRFTDDTGKAHELTRSRQKDRMSITYDGYAIRQTDLNEMFGERDVFLSIFNPLYFIEELGEDGKKLLERYLPPVQQADVLPLLNEQTQQRLSGLKLLSPETFLKNRREEIRTLEQDAVYLSGKLDLAQKQRQSSKELSAELNAQIQDLQREIASLEARRFENVNLEDLQEQLVQASEQYEELSGEAPEVLDTAELDAKLQEFHAKLGARSSEVYQPKYTGPLAEDTAKVQALGKKYQQNAALLKRFQPGTSCPVCRRVLSQQEYPAFRQALQAETEKIAADGTQLKGQIAELQELEQKSQSTFEQFKAEDIERYQSEIGALNQKREQLQENAAQQNMQRQQTLEQLRARIQNLTASIECGTLSPADSERLAECKASLEDCRVQLAAAQQVLSAAPEDFDTRIKAIEEEIAEKKIVVEAEILGDRLHIALAQLIAQLGECHVAALRKGRFEIDFAVRLSAAQAGDRPAAEILRAGADERAVEQPGQIVQRRGQRHDLEHRAGGIEPLQAAVEIRRVGHARAQPRRIVFGHGHHGENLAGLVVHDNRSAVIARGEGARDHARELRVYCQLNVVAARGLSAQPRPRAVDDRAGHAHQRAGEECLHARAGHAHCVAHSLRDGEADRHVGGILPLARRVRIGQHIAVAVGDRSHGDGLFRVVEARVVAAHRPARALRERRIAEPAAGAYEQAQYQRADQAHISSDFLHAASASCLSARSTSSAS